MARRTLLTNCTVLTLDHETDAAEGLVIEGTRILGLGARDDMRTLAGSDADVVNLDGAFVIPGLIDSHPHAMHFTAYRIGAVDLLDAENFDDIVHAVRSRAAVTPKGEWIVCTPVGEPHYFVRRDYTSLAERRMPERNVLDAAAPDHPVWIMAWAPRTPNVCAFNSLALKRLRVSAQVPDRVCDVYFEKDSSGLPTGIVRGKVNNYYNDDPYWHALSALLPQLPNAVWPVAGLAGVREANAQGVTGLYEAHAMMPPHIEAYEQMEREGTCTARVVMSVELSGYAFSTMDYEEADSFGLLEWGHRRQRKRGERVRTNGVTLSRGGPLSQGYLRMNDPYPGPFGEPTRGKTFLSRAVERRVVEYCLANELRLNMVIGGYRDHDDWLATLRDVAKPEDFAPHEWVLQHCYFTAPAHIEAYRAYRFHVTTSSSFVYGKADVVRQKFPEAAMADFIAMRRFMDAGLNLACGRDWGPDNVWRQMALNETREGAATGHHHIEHGNQLTRLQSLHAFTRNGAAVMMWPELGRLRAGGPADIAVLDRNPLTCSVEALAEMRVLQTLLDGVAVHRV